jgi:hypothetical protein
MFRDFITKQALAFIIAVAQAKNPIYFPAFVKTSSLFLVFCV